MERHVLAFRYTLLWLFLAAGTLGGAGWAASHVGWPGAVAVALAGLGLFTLCWRSIGKDPRVVPNP